MLIQLLSHNPAAIGSVIQRTPTGVFALLLVLVLLGLSQARNRTVGAPRMAIIPVCMAALSLWGTASAFGQSAQLPWVLLVWLAGALLVGTTVALQKPCAGTRYNKVHKSFNVPGSWAPLLLIVGIFLTKYVVGVDLAMQPSLASDSAYALSVEALCGMFSGAFAGRTARLWRMALGPNQQALA
jgi:hypothetical protein